MYGDIGDPSWSRNSYGAISLGPSFILLPRAMSIAPSTGPTISFAPTSMAPTLSCRKRAPTGATWPATQAQFRFVQVSTDEVYGSLKPEDPPFAETNAYAPNSPYSASKASADHLVRAYHHTYGLPTLTTNCSNNYGPFQFPEKLIPLVILNACAGKPIPVYGDGKNVRDWLLRCRPL